MAGDAAFIGKNPTRNAHAEMGPMTLRIGASMARVVSAFVDNVQFGGLQICTQLSFKGCNRWQRMRAAHWAESGLMYLFRYTA